MLTAGSHIVRFAQAPADMACQLQRDLGGDQAVGFQQAHEISAEKYRKRGVRRRSRLRAARRVIEQRQIAEESSRSKLNGLTVASLALREDQYAAVDDDIDCLPLI